MIYAKSFGCLNLLALEDMQDMIHSRIAFQPRRCHRAILLSIWAYAEITSEGAQITS